MELAFSPRGEGGGYMGLRPTLVWCAPLALIVHDRQERVECDTSTLRELVDSQVLPPRSRGRVSIGRQVFLRG